MSYREHAPPAALAAWVACAWERCADGEVPVRVLPDGCIDVVWTEGRDVRVVGPNTTAFLVTLPSGVRVAGVRMLPGAAVPLLGIDPATLRDGHVALAEAWADEGHRVAERVAAADDRVAALLAALEARAARAAAPDPLVRAAVARLRDPRARVDALSRELHVSARQLRRRFERSVGYGPKRLARVLRLQRALGAARGGDELARAAAAAGFVDQAHFAHDCRALAGVPPSALL